MLEFETYLDFRDYIKIILAECLTVKYTGSRSAWSSEPETIELLLDEDRYVTLSSGRIEV